MTEAEVTLTLPWVIVGPILVALLVPTVKWLIKVVARAGVEAVVRAVNKHLKPRLENIEKRLETVEAEVTLDSGSSLKDLTKQIARQVGVPIPE